jgi:hypothetical protein
MLEKDFIHRAHGAAKEIIFVESQSETARIAVDGRKWNGAKAHADGAIRRQFVKGVDPDPVFGWNFRLQPIGGNVDSLLNERADDVMRIRAL